MGAWACRGTPIADLEGRPFPAGIERRVTVRDRPDAVAVGADVYPLGVARLIGQSAAQLHRGVVGWLRGLAGGAAARSLAGVSLPRTNATGGRGEEVEELDRLSRVFVMLPSQLDASNFGELFLAGLKADRSPWGLGWASEYGFDVQYSSATVPRGVLGFVQRAVRAVVGVDLVHGWANRRAINDADLILTHMEREWVSAAFTLKSKRPNGPKLVANTIWLPGEWARRNGFWRWAVNRARRKVDYFTFNAKPALEGFAQLFGEDTPLHYVVFGTSWESFIPATRTPDPDRCVLVAGDDRYRDWSLLESVASRLPEVQFVVASKSSPPSLAGLGNVEIQIASGPREMQRLYERCAVSFIPSRPNLHASGITVALETARVGRPIVITDTGGIADYFSPDEVAFCEVGDVADASRRIRELLANPDHSRILSSAATARITRSRNDSRSFAERLLKAVGALD